jgi:hypothetical protein
VENGWIVLACVKWFSSGVGIVFKAIRRGKASDPLFTF